MDRAWRDEWRALDRATRHHIEAEVRAGRALGTQREAALAVGCARRWRRRMLAGALLVGPMVAGAMAGSAALTDDPFDLTVVVAVTAISVIVSGLMLPRAARAERANAVVAEQPDPPPGPDVLDALRGAATRAVPGRRPGGARPRPRDGTSPDG